MESKIEALVKVANYYYNDGLTQTQIADRLGVSRPTVAKMLAEARQKEIVKITIQTHLLNDYKKEKLVREKYNLKSVQIVASLGNDEATKIEIGRRGAQYIESRLDEIKSLGIGWGTTIQKFVEAANHLDYPDLSIVPLMGGVSLSEVKIHSNHLVFTLGQKYNAIVNLLYAPAIAENLEVKHILTNSKIVQSLLNKGKDVDLAVISVGNPRESRTYREMGYITEMEQQEIIAEKAVGDILASFFNDDGNLVNTSLSERMIGHSLEDIKQMKEVLVIASGIEKTVSLKPLLVQDYIDHLIIDSNIAQELL